MRVSTSNGGSVFLADHAVDRWHERCRPGKDRAGAQRDLVQLVRAVGVVVEVRPSWLGVWRTSEPADAYLMVGADICLPLRKRTASTCITAGEPSPLALAERSQRRARATATRKDKRSVGRGGGDVAARRGAGYRKRHRREGWAG